MQLVSVQVRHERRIRLVFSTSLGSGAFLGAGGIVIACTNDVGSDPAPTYRIAVPGSPTVLEIALDRDLVDGAAYVATLSAIPAADSSTCSDTGAFVVGDRQVVINVETQVSDRDALLHGVDVVWTGADLLEDDSGDLAAVAGPSNTAQALRRRAVADALAWDPSYGGAIRGAVDGPAPAIGALRGTLVRQLLLDDRVKDVSMGIVSDDASPNQVVLNAQVSLVGSSATQDVAIAVPVS